MADYLAFSDIYGAIEAAMKEPEGSQQTLAKSMANMVYLNEIMEADDLYPFHWLLDFDDSLKSKDPAETVTGITKANPCVVSDATHTFVVGDLVLCHEVVGMTELNGRVFSISAVVAATSFTLADIDGTGINSTSFTTWTSGGKFKHLGVKLATTGKDIKRVLSAGWHDLNKNMDEIHYDELEASKTYLLGSSPSRPTRWRHIKRYKTDGTETNYLQWFTGADDSYKLRYWFEKRVARLSADADVPQIPPQFHDMIVAGALARLAENNVQVENAVVWPGIYTAQLELFKSFNRKYYQEHPEWLKEKVYML